MPLPLLAPPPALVVRDAYGVPFVKANSAEAAWTGAGRAVAEDRWGQMDLSRHLARGTLASILGEKYKASDLEVLKTAYTDEELNAQFAKFPKEIQSAWRAYAVGINEVRAKAAPASEGWTTLDSMAMMVHLLQLFGNGGAGEMRNLAILTYLQGRKALNGQALDAFDDLAWQTDPNSLATASKPFDPQKIYPAFTRADTEKQLSVLPKLSLFELLPLIDIAQKETSTRVAQNLNLPFKTGSYAVVVPGTRSATGEPLLMNGPQMGFSNPSVVHLMGMEAPGIEVQGMDVPGVPGVLVGATPNLAWGLTSGVTDLEDVLFQQKPTMETIRRTVHVKDGADVEAVRSRTADGNVIWQKPNVGAFVLARSFEGEEWRSYVGVTRLWKAKDGVAALKGLTDATMAFNFFWADRNGAGYKHLGRVPIRAGGDPRLPAIGTRKTAWRGFLNPSEMPAEVARDTVISNWNNLPAPGWPNGDTPAWGEGFRGRTLREALEKPKLSEDDLVAAARSIAVEDENWPVFKAYHAEGPLAGWDGMRLAGDEKPSLFGGWEANLRKELFGAKLGDFVAPQFSSLILQPSTMLHALQGKTKVDYLAGRSAADVVAKAREGIVGNPFVVPTIPVTGGEPIPYSNRGTYLQIVRLTKKGSTGRNVTPPGEAESGPHRIDMADLSRTWTFRPMVPWD